MRRTDLSRAPVNPRVMSNGNAGGGVSAAAVNEALDNRRRKKP